MGLKVEHRSVEVVSYELRWNEPSYSWAQAKLQPLERSGLALCAGIFIIDPEFKLLIDIDLGSAEP